MRSGLKPPPIGPPGPAPRPPPLPSPGGPNIIPPPPLPEGGPNMFCCGVGGGGSMEGRFPGMPGPIPRPMPIADIAAIDIPAIPGGGRGGGNPASLGPFIPNIPPRPITGGGRGGGKLSFLRHAIFSSLGPMKARAGEGKPCMVCWGKTPLAFTGGGASALGPDFFSGDGRGSLFKNVFANQYVCSRGISAIPPNPARVCCFLFATSSYLQCRFLLV